MQRRDLLLSTAAVAAGAALSGGLSGCGAPGDLIRADVSRARPEPARSDGTVQAVSDVSLRLLERLDAGRNLVCSPLSVLVALAMVRNGAAGRTASEMDEALGLPALDDLNAGMNVIDQTLATRSGRRGGGARKGKVELDLANAVWGQRGYSWEEPFLRALATSYGTGVHPVDFDSDAARARKVINAWVANRTRDRITDIATPEVVHEATRLALVNALYCRAPWATPCSPADDRSFEVGGEQVGVPMIRTFAARHVEGPGWRAARIPLLGDELALTVVRPDGDLDTALSRLSRSGLRPLLDPDPTELVDLTMPSFTLRTTVDLVTPLAALGVVEAFSEGAEFPGLTTTDQLHLTAVRHMGYLAVDADGIEAAATTLVTAEPVSAPAGPAHVLVLDRPFLFVLHDVELGLPLLLGTVVDPR